MPRSPTLDGAFAFVTFGRLLTQQGELKASDIFRRLFSVGEWYIPRRSNVLRIGTNLLFYQSGAGFRGCATVAEIAPAGSSNPLGVLFSNSFSERLRLKKMEQFASPVSVAPIVEDLDFVANKKWWGTALRGTPRAISAKDYLVIMSCAHPQELVSSKG